jgi:hypothetical protein
MAHVSDRYDFSHWPPMPVEQPPVLPAQSADVDELCHDMLYIPNPSRKRAVYATGDWVDIVDFWLEADEPKENALLKVGDGSVRVMTAWHLGAPTYAFHQLAYELCYRACDEVGIDPNDLASQSKTPLYRFLLGKVTNPTDTETSNQHLLIARKVLTDIYDGLDDLPLGLGKKSRLILAKVALRWGYSLDMLALTGAAG